jgi:hypothetical protein
MDGTLSVSGSLSCKVIRAQKAPLSWSLKNSLTWRFIWGWFVTQLAHGFSKLTGIVTITSELRIRVKRAASGNWIDYGVVSRRVVTDTGVAYIVDCWDNTATVLANMNYHGCGTGAGAEGAGETALVTECTTALNPDSTRATGTRSQPAANQYRSIGTLTFDATPTVIEHGLLSQAATGGGVLWDRSLFAGITVASGDSIQFTYTVSLTSGG